MIIKGFSKISGVGSYLPHQVVTSHELMEEIGSEKFGIPSIYMQDRLGIKTRRYAQKNEQHSDIACEAGKAAIIDAGLHTSEIQAVIYCGIDRDFKEPATAHCVADKIGINADICSDTSNACHGFMDGLFIANNLFASSKVEHVLVCTAEKGSEVIEQALHRIQNQGCTHEEFKRWIGVLTVGDAGGAVILSRKTGSSGIVKFNLNSNSNYNHLCYYHTNNQSIEGQMIMDKISAVMLRLHKKAIDTTYDELRWQPQQITKLICHQVGITPLKKMAGIARVPFESVTNTIAEFANLASATIPVNLAISKPAEGEKLLVMGAGSGLSISQVGIIK